ncbi:14802_t:CDS:2, partial [Acaulospora colombiana]
MHLDIKSRSGRCANLDVEWSHPGRSNQKMQNVEAQVHPQSYSPPNSTMFQSARSEPPTPFCSSQVRRWDYPQEKQPKKPARKKSSPTRDLSSVIKHILQSFAKMSEESVLHGLNIDEDAIHNDLHRSSGAASSVNRDLELAMWTNLHFPEEPIFSPERDQA